MIDGNNGGYANDWLIGDRKTGEIARLELGLKHTKLWRTHGRLLFGREFRERSGRDQGRNDVRSE